MIGCDAFPGFSVCGVFERVKVKYSHSQIIAPIVFNGKVIGKERGSNVLSDNQVPGHGVNVRAVNGSAHWLRFL
jgi:hypothetical protein